MITFDNRFFPIRSAACFLVDGGVILLSVISSFLILERTGIVKLLDFQDAVVRGLIIALFCQSCMYILDLYDLKLSHSWGELFFSLVFAVGFFLIGIGVISYIVPVFGVESRMYYLAILLVTILLMMWRMGFYYYIYKISPSHNILIIGGGQEAQLVSTEIDIRKRYGFRLVGFVMQGKESDTGVSPYRPANVLGEYEQIGDIARKFQVHEIVIATGNRRGEYPIREMLDLRVKGYRIVEWQPFFEKLSGRIPIDNLAPSFFIFSEGFRKSPFVQWIRRGISFVVSIAGLILLSPFFLILCLLIRLDSPGRAFYRQKRIGLNGRSFTLLKFRSMVENSENDSGPRWAIDDDPRTTRVGRWIRKYRIDEFPQLVNVLKGDLDLVGPRPERPMFVEKLEQTIPYYALRHTIRPGITGWAQVMFPYCGTVEESKEKLQYDLFYVKNMSVKLDLLIIIRTVKILVLGRGSR